jgi:oxalate---CoA ligase
MVRERPFRFRGKRMSETVAQLLARGADGAPAIRAPEGRAALSHAALRALGAETVAALNARGIGRGDRVAIVLPNGPEMAACFVAVAQGATTAPLNPAYREDEFAFYIEDLRAKALIVQKGWETPARAAAARLGVPVIELAPDAARGAGAFTLEGGAAGAAAQPGAAEAGDVALVLHTSGTTARPKIVPLSQANVARLGAAHRRDARAVARRHLPQHHAAVPHPRAHRRRAVLARRGRRGDLHGRV